MTWALALVASYAIGSIPTGYWLGLAWKGIDVRQQGSGNLGATNVFRVLGKGPGIVTLIADILKGLIPVLVVRSLAPASTTLPVIVGLGAIAGHTTSPWVGFRGGKGVATSAGVFLALLPVPSLISIAVFVGLFATTHIVSVSSLGGALGLSLASWFLSTVRPYAWMATGIALFIFWTHRSNVSRLLQGKEERLTEGGRPS